MSDEPDYRADVNMDEGYKVHSWEGEEVSTSDFNERLQNLFSERDSLKLQLGEYRDALKEIFRIAPDGSTEWEIASVAFKHFTNAACIKKAHPDWQSLDRDKFVGDVSTAPTGNPEHGEFVYTDEGSMRRRLDDGNVEDIPTPDVEWDVCSKCGWSGKAEDDAGCQTWSRSLGMDPNNKGKMICSDCRAKSQP